MRNTNIAMDSFRSSMLSVKDTTDAVESGSTDMKEKTENAVNANEQVATAVAMLLPKYPAGINSKPDD